jgi:hypothetical protein
MRQAFLPPAERSPERSLQTEGKKRIVMNQVAESDDLSVDERSQSPFVGADHG